MPSINEYINDATEKLNNYDEWNWKRIQKLD